LRKASEANDSEMAALRIIKEECVLFLRPLLIFNPDFRNISKLLASQSVINAREKEIVSLKAEVKSQIESKAEIRALSVLNVLSKVDLRLLIWSSQRLAEAKKLLGEKEVELRAKDP
jgi:hypothetical protein